MSLKDVGVESDNGVAVIVGGGGRMMRGIRRRHDFDQSFVEWREGLRGFI